MTAPVSICMIVKNESKQIEACLKSIRPHVAQICIVDTGSTDNTPEICKKYADIFEIWTGCNGPDGKIENFSKARNRSLSLATQPWVMWIDGDDEVSGAEHLEALIIAQDADRNGQPRLVLFQYEYAHDDHGNPIVLHWRERLVTPKEHFEWRGAVHEVLVPKLQCPFKDSDLIKIIHRRDMAKMMGDQTRNLRILQANYEIEGDKDVRSLYYLGLEYGYVGDLDNAIKFHEKYVELSGWDDEKALSMLKLADHFLMKDNSKKSLDWALRATMVCETWGETYFSIARTHYLMAQRGIDEPRNWRKCVHFARLGLSLPPTKTVLFVNPLEREVEIHRFLNFALNKLGDVAGARESVLTALKKYPDDQGLKENLRLYEIHLAKIEMANLQTKLNILEAK